MPEHVHTDAAFSTDAPYSQAVIHGDSVYVSGQLPFDGDGHLVEGDIKEQAEQVLENVGSILAAAGSSMDDLVKVTVYLTDIDDFDAFNESYRELVPPPRPARSAVEVSDISIDVGLEVDAIAAR